MYLVMLISKIINFVFFFFQAEDGIRDSSVTGVQTCALPISPLRIDFHRKRRGGRLPGVRVRVRATEAYIARSDQAGHVFRRQLERRQWSVLAESGRGNLIYRYARSDVFTFGPSWTRSPTVFLCGARPRRTEGEDVRAGITVDQIAAATLGQDTPLPSLELATEDMTGLIGACDVGFSCTYTNTNSWKTATTPLPMEINPRVVFNLLFGDGSNPTERINRMQRQRSILDAVTDRVTRLEKKLGPADRNRMAEYLENVREIERRIQLAEKQHGSNLELPATPVGIPDDHEEHSRLMMDLIALAFEAEITRVSTFMMAREVSYRNFPKIGVAEPFHSVSHHQDKPEALEKLTKINTYHVSLVNYLLESLKR